MKARAQIVVGRGGRLVHVRSSPPLSVRQIHGDDTDVCVLCLVGSAAGPLAGDEIGLDVEVQAGAQAVLTNAGAALAQGRGAGPPSHLVTNVHVNAGADLQAEPSPLVVCAGARVDVALSIGLARTARLRWRELVVLGRTAEPSGQVSVRWDVQRDGAPLLRQQVDLMAESPWFGLVGGARVLATELRVGWPSATVVLHDRAVAQQFAPDCTLLTVLSADAAGAQTDLAELGGRLGAVTHVRAPASAPAVAATRA